MQSKNNSASSRPASPSRKASTSSISETLTPSELEQLPRADKETRDYAQKTFTLRRRPFRRNKRPAATHYFEPYCNSLAAGWSAGLSATCRL